MSFLSRRLAVISLLLIFVLTGCSSAFMQAEKPTLDKLRNNHVNGTEIEKSAPPAVGFFIEKKDPIKTIEKKSYADQTVTIKGSGVRLQTEKTGYGRLEKEPFADAQINIKGALLREATNTPGIYNIESESRGFRRQGFANTTIEIDRPSLFSGSGDSSHQSVLTAVNVFDVLQDKGIANEETTLNFKGGEGLDDIITLLDKQYDVHFVGRNLDGIKATQVNYSGEDLKSALKFLQNQYNLHYFYNTETDTITVSGKKGRAFRVSPLSKGLRSFVVSAAEKTDLTIPYFSENVKDGGIVEVVGKPDNIERFRRIVDVDMMGEITLADLLRKIDEKVSFRVIPESGSDTGVGNVRFDVEDIKRISETTLLDILVYLHDRYDLSITYETSSNVVRVGKSSAKRFYVHGINKNSALRKAAEGIAKDAGLTYKVLSKRSGLVRVSGSPAQIDSFQRMLVRTSSDLLTIGSMFEIAEEQSGVVFHVGDSERLSGMDADGVPDRSLSLLDFVRYVRDRYDLYVSYTPDTKVIEVKSDKTYRFKLPSMSSEITTLLDSIASKAKASSEGGITINYESKGTGLVEVSATPSGFRRFRSLLETQMARSLSVGDLVRLARTQVKPILIPGANADASGDRAKNKGIDGIPAGRVNIRNMEFVDFLRYLVNRYDVHVDVNPLSDTITVQKNESKRIILPPILASQKGEIGGESDSVSVKAEPDNLRDVIETAAKNLNVDINVFSKTTGVLQMKGRPSDVDRLCDIIETEASERLKFVTIQISFLEFTVKNTYSEKFNLSAVKGLSQISSGAIGTFKFNTSGLISNRSGGSQETVSMDYDDPNSNFSSMISFLEKWGTTQVVMDPSVMTANGVPVSFNITDEIGYWQPGSVDTSVNENSVVTERGQPEFKSEEVGFNLRVRPKVIRDSENKEQMVELDVYLENSEVSSFSTTSWRPHPDADSITISKPLKSSKTLSTRGIVGSDEMLVLASLNDKYRESGKTGIPGMVNIKSPLDRLTSLKSNMRKDSKILILINATMPDENKAKQSTAKKR